MYYRFKYKGVDTWQIAPCHIQIHGMLIGMWNLLMMPHKSVGLCRTDPCLWTCGFIKYKAHAVWLAFNPISDKQQIYPDHQQRFLNFYSVLCLVSNVLTLSDMMIMQEDTVRYIWMADFYNTEVSTKTKSAAWLYDTVNVNKNGILPGWYSHTWLSLKPYIHPSSWFFITWSQRSCTIS